MEGYVQAGYSWQDMPARFWVRDNATGKDSDSVRGKLKRDQAFGAGNYGSGAVIAWTPSAKSWCSFPMG